MVNSGRNVVQVVPYREIHTTCLNVHIMSDPHHGRVFYGTFFAFAFVLPMILICALYATMILRLLRRRVVGGGGDSGGKRGAYGTGSSETTRARRRVTRLVMVVVAAFGACWLPIHVDTLPIPADTLPIHVVFIIQFFGDESLMTHTFIVVRLAANCLAYANSCLNPILYAFLSENFRSGLVLLCCRGRARHGNAVVETRGRRELTTAGHRDGLGAGARPLLALGEDREDAVKEATATAANVLQIPTYTRTRQAETSAVVETAL